MYISSTFFVVSFSSDLPIEVILSPILFPIKSLVVSAVFWTTCLGAVFAACITVFVAVPISFLPYLLPNFQANEKRSYTLIYFLNFDPVEYLTFILSTQ